MSVNEGLVWNEGIGNRAAEHRLQADALFGERLRESRDIDSLAERRDCVSV